MELPYARGPHDSVEQIFEIAQHDASHHGCGVCVRKNLKEIDSSTHHVLTSREVLGDLRTDLEVLGFIVETDKTAAGKFRYPCCSD